MRYTRKEENQDRVKYFFTALYMFLVVPHVGGIVYTHTIS